MPEASWLYTLLPLEKKADASAKHEKPTASWLVPLGRDRR
jgi:hypothetical protein